MDSSLRTDRLIINDLFSVQRMIRKQTSKILSRLCIIWKPLRSTYVIKSLYPSTVISTSLILRVQLNKRNASVCMQVIHKYENIIKKKNFNFYLSSGIVRNKCINKLTQILYYPPLVNLNYNQTLSACTNKLMFLDFIDYVYVIMRLKLCIFSHNIRN